jgi:SWI/SNF-related matrix-associated actin-dependent regulator of chromatin subfamily A3
LQIGSTYENPHALSFSDMQILSYENQLDVARNRPPRLDDTEGFKETISNVYSSLTRGAKLSKIEGDRRLKRTLLP